MKQTKNLVRVAIVGYGYWGPNLVRNFNEVNEVEIKYVCDLRKDSLEKVQKKYPQIKVTTNYDEILNDKSVNAVIVATPTSTHYLLAKKALSAGKNVWVEKPMTNNSVHAKELVDLAKQKKVILHVDHTFLYNSAVQKIYELISSGKIGKIYYFDSVRINLGLFQPDTSVIWDLATHDISIMCYLLGQNPQSISVSAHDHIVKGLKDTAHLNFTFPNRVSGHIQVSWLSPVKIRRTLIGGSKKMIVYDDLETTEKVKVYDYGVKKISKNDLNLTTANYQYRTGAVVIPEVGNQETLNTEVTHFINAIKTSIPTKTDGNNGLQVVKILETADQSLIKGECIKI